MKTPLLFWSGGGAATALIILVLARAAAQTPAPAPVPGGAVRVVVVPGPADGGSERAPAAVAFPGASAAGVPGVLVAVPVPAPGDPAATNVPATTEGDAAGADEADDLTQTNNPAEPDGADSVTGADGVVRPGRVGSRNTYDGRQSRRRRYERPDAQRPSAMADAAAAAAGTNGAARYDYASFQVIVQRNIFDPNRRPYRPGVPREDTTPRRANDFVSLVGVMSYDSGQYAFFGGSQSRYEKSAQVSDVIADCRVSSINVLSNSVTLERGTNHLELRVGMQMRKDEEGHWQVSRGPALFASYSATPNPGGESATPAGGSASASASGASATEDNDVIKRLMQRREQQ